jgi:sec-independent protein translocase protein TatA
MGSLSIGHWIIFALVVLLLFGAGRLGEVGKGLGEGIRNFKKGVTSDNEDEDNAEAAAKQLKKGTKSEDDVTDDKKAQKA